MHHKASVTLNLFQGLYNNPLIAKSYEMLKRVQHDVQIDNMTQYVYT